MFCLLNYFFPIRKSRPPAVIYLGNENTIQPTSTGVNQNFSNFISSFNFSFMNRNMNNTVQNSQQQSSHVIDRNATSNNPMYANLINPMSAQRDSLGFNPRSSLSYQDTSASNRNSQPARYSRNNKNSNKNLIQNINATDSKKSPPGLRYDQADVLQSSREEMV